MARINNQIINLTGNRWSRARGITIFNEYNKPPRIVIDTEIITQDDAGTFLSTVPSGLKTVNLVPGQTFPLINPMTAETIGTTSADQLYTILYSLIHKVLTSPSVNP